MWQECSESAQEWIIVLKVINNNKYQWQIKNGCPNQASKQMKPNDQQAKEKKIERMGEKDE